MDGHDRSRRAWFAWHCLPRDEKGEKPSIRGLESLNDLSNSQLNKLIYAISKRPSFDELRKMAKALRVSLDWLVDGTGDGPIAKFEVPPWPGPRKKKARSVVGTSVESAFNRDAKKLAKRGST